MHTIKAEGENKMSCNFENKVVLITGGSSGMGKCHVEHFANKGAIVYFTDIKEQEGMALANQLGQNVHFIAQDVASEQDWQHVANVIEQQQGKLDVLVNNAGIVTYAPIGQMSLEQYMRVVNVNQTSIFLGLSTMLELLKKGQNPSVINISSIAGIKTSPGGVAYSSSKFAVRAITEVAAQEFAPFGIRVNVICPGAVETPMLVQEDTKAAVEQFAKKIPLCRIGQPEELTKTVLFLASEDSSYMTGSTIVVDGGSCLVM